MSGTLIRGENTTRCTRDSFHRTLCPALVLGVLALAAGCGDSTGPSEVDDLDDVNAYLASLPTWAAFAQIQDTVDAPVGTGSVDMSNLVLCTKTPYSITQNPEEIVTFGSAPNVLYLGSLIQGNSYLGGLGSMEELPIRQRAPLVLAVNLFSGTEITSTVEDPDAASVQSALNEIVSTASASGHRSGSRVYFNKAETYSLTQATLRLGLSARYMGASASMQLSYSANHEEHTIAAYFKQIMYEAYIVPPQTPAGFFSAAFTNERLDEQKALGNIGPTNLPVYVGRMQYGRMMMFTMTSTADLDSMKMAIEGSYSGFGSYNASTEAALREILQTSEYTIVTIGGSSSTALSMLRSGSLDSYFGADDPLTTAVPLGYVLYNVADGSIATVSETTSYQVNECSERKAEYYHTRTEWQNRVNGLAGNRLSQFEYRTTADSIGLADELSGPPAVNANLGNQLTWRSSATAYPFMFRLRTHQPGYILVYDDREGSRRVFGTPEQDRSISIGNGGGQTDDDFHLYLDDLAQGTAVFAIGMEIGDNKAEPEEFVRVHGMGGFETQFADGLPDCFNSTSFLGIVSTVPLTELFVNEDAASDEIFVRDFVFGVLTWEI